MKIIKLHCYSLMHDLLAREVAHRRIPLQYLDEIELCGLFLVCRVEYLKDFSQQSHYLKHLLCLCNDLARTLLQRTCRLY